MAYLQPILFPKFSRKNGEFWDPDKLLDSVLDVLEEGGEMRQVTNISSNKLDKLLGSFAINMKDKKVTEPADILGQSTITRNAELHDNPHFIENRCFAKLKQIVECLDSFFYYY